MRRYAGRRRIWFVIVINSGRPSTVTRVDVKQLIDSRRTNTWTVSTERFRRKWPCPGSSR